VVVIKRDSDSEKLEYSVNAYLTVLNDHYPDLINMGKSEEAYQRLFQAIREGWDAIAQKAIHELIKSMDT
jgi:hypothetical protein